MQDFCPVHAIFQVEPGLDVVARGDPDIEAGVCGAGFEHGIERVGLGGADLAGFFHDSEVPRVGDPCCLGGKEPDAAGKCHFGGDGSR